MTGEELDREIRKVFQSVTPETVLSATARLVELGFGPHLAFTTLATVLEKRPRE